MSYSIKNLSTRNMGTKRMITTLSILISTFLSHSQQLEPGNISQGDQVIAPNTYPGFLTATMASGGACGNYYVYQWQESVDNIVFTNLVGEQQANIQLFFPLDNTRYYRRAVTCGATTAYTPSVKIGVALAGLEDNKNFVREISVQKEGVKLWSGIENLLIGEKFVSTTYLDGLGRNLQLVESGVSPTLTEDWNDLVKPFEYDAAGRMTKDFLAFSSADNPGKFKTDAISAQTNFLQEKYGVDAVGAITYRKIDYTPSPLAIPQNFYMPGVAWEDKPVSSVPGFNDVEEEVHIWTIGSGSVPLPQTTLTSVYESGTLVKHIAKDERDNQVITYTDKNGNIILKKVQENYQSGLTMQHSGWVCTYYVYDVFSRLRFIIPATLVTHLDDNDWAVNEDMVSELCFQYEYDGKGRKVKSKVPGRGVEYNIYDMRNRPVFSQDANQRAENKWLALLYDELNRPVITGIITYEGTMEDLQSFVDTETAAEPTPYPGPLIDLFFNSEENEGNAQAIRSITLLPGFESGDDFSAEITPGLGGFFNDITVIEGVKVHKNPLPASSNLILLTVTYRDDYDYSGVKGFSDNYSLAYSTNVEGVSKSLRTTGIITGEKVRILDGDGNEENDKFLISSIYYDEKGRVQQVLSDNIKAGIDYTVFQYDFAGNVMSEFNSHTQGTTTFTTITKNQYDRTGRLIKLFKNFNNSFYKELVSFQYDELGQLQSKLLAPGYAGSQLEKLTYDYNIQGWLTGINKNYALETDNLSQWDNYFGLYLGYENGDNKFDDAQFDGKITGLIWRSQGDNSVRKFNFNYDRLGRFTSAFFTQKKRPGDVSWSNQEMDFSESVSYSDANGNIDQLTRYGVIPGQSMPQLVDNLQYSYNMIGGTGLRGNKLQKVDDFAGLGSNDGLLGDFKDMTSTQDYDYDENGNLVTDQNKGIKNASENGITYNYLDKPQKIVIEGKSVIEYMYDATGERLQKKVTYGDNSSRLTTYIAGFVYEQFIPSDGPVSEERLLYVQHEEGRLKIITPHVPEADLDFLLNAGASGVLDLPGNKQGVFEYFIKDHLGSVRMVLTEEEQVEYYVATMEDNTAGIEEQFFGQVDENGIPSSANELIVTRKNTPIAWTSNSTDKVVELTASSPQKVIGPNMVLRVMAGDIINGSVGYFFANNSNSGDGNPLNMIGTSLINSMMGVQASAIGKSQMAAISTGLTNSDDFINFISRSGSIAASPKAYLNIVFLDEQFGFIETDPGDMSVGSHFTRVNPDMAGIQDFLSFQQKAPKNGWAYIYLSNTSNEPVYFDDLWITHSHGRVSEETHYYPFGQKIAAISGRAFNKLANRYNYQGSFSEYEEETGYNEFDLRMYDAQIARWTGMDPYDEYANPYTGMGNDPINNVDPDGGRISPGGWGAIVGAVGFGTSAYLIASNNSDRKWTAYAWAGLSAFIGAGLGYGDRAAYHSGAYSNFGGNLKAFYIGFFAYHEGYVTSFDRNGAVISNAEIPDIWGAFSFATNKKELIEIDIPSGNPTVLMKTKSNFAGALIRANSSQISLNISGPKLSSCPCISIQAPTNPLFFNFDRSTQVTDDMNMVDASLSDGQFNGIRRLANLLGNQLMPGDNLSNFSVSHTSSVGLSSPNLVPVTDPNTYVIFNPVANRRAATATANSIQRPVTGVGNTIIQNFTAQTNSARAYLSNRFGVGVTPNTVLGSGTGGSSLFRIRARITRPRTTTVLLCPCGK